MHGTVLITAKKGNAKSKVMQIKMYITHIWWKMYLLPV